MGYLNCDEYIDKDDSICNGKMIEIGSTGWTIQETDEDWNLCWMRVAMLIQCANCKTVKID